MSRADLRRQHHRALTPTVRAGSVDDIPLLPDSKRMDVPAPSAENFAMRVRETLMVMLGRQGDPLDRGITLRDLIDAGVVTLSPGYELGTGGAIPIGPGSGGAASAVKPDLTPPPTPTGFIATGGLANVFFETDPPKFAMGHGYFVTNVYAARQVAGQPPPTFDKAEQVYSFTGDVGSWATTPETLWFFWVKWETRDGVESVQPAGGTNGYQAMTGQDVERLVAAMTGPGEPFKVVTQTTVLPDGSVIQPGTYTADAYIHNGFIKTAMIANLSVDNAKVVSLAVDKLRSGSLTVGNYIQSSNYVANSQGWRIDANGYAEMQNVLVRGTGSFQGAIYAESGYFKGDISASYGSFSGGVRGGSYVGWAWPAGGGMGFFLGGPGMLMGNQPNGNPYIYFDANGGTFIISSGNGKPGLTVDPSGSTFTGALNITSGGATRMEITSSQIRVYENNVLRVRMGVGF